MNPEIAPDRLAGLSISRSVPSLLHFSPSGSCVRIASPTTASRFPPPPSRCVPEARATATTRTPPPPRYLPPHPSPFSPLPRPRGARRLAGAAAVFHGRFRFRSRPFRLHHPARLARKFLAAAPAISPVLALRYLIGIPSRGGG